MSKPSLKGLRYGEYGLILILAILGFSGILYYGNIIPFYIEIYLGLLLTTFGAYTIAFVLYYRKRATKEERNYMFLWGYVSTALGISLLAYMYTFNLLFNTSLAVFIGAIIALLSAKYVR
ncbi:MAG: hypothetical protein QXJ17_08535 [Nitrososphaeria archaeon]